MRLVNKMDVPTAIHWHGVRTPNAMDGVPGLTQEAVAPGATHEYRFTVPDAGTFWYHPPVNASGQRLRGPYGPLIVTEREPPEVDRETMLFIDELPSLTLVSIIVRTNERLRLRLVNAISRCFRCGSADLSAWVMAIDSQPSEPFPARNGRVTLGPGNRVDLFVDATAAAGENAQIVLENVHAPARPSIYDRAEPCHHAPLPMPAACRLIHYRNRSIFAAPSSSTCRLQHCTTRTQAAPAFQRPEWPPSHAGPGHAMNLAHAVHVHGHHFRLLDRLDDGWKPFWLPIP